jgi:ElaB/YqjD/DUF883 family membrane-anchored ribosome-binding protein
MADSSAASQASETGFLKMSHLADALPDDRWGRAGVEGEGDRAAEPGHDLERLVIEQIRSRPLQALGFAAAAGFVVGIWASR